jgi:hypothetical protein
MTGVLRVPRTLHSTLASVWFSLAIGSRKDLRSVGIMQHVKLVQHAEPPRPYFSQVIFSVTPQLRTYRYV